MTGLRRAFTLAEVVMVTAIMAILIAVGVPAFRSAMESTDKSQAVDRLRLAIAGARAAALRSDGQDTAAVFLYRATPGGGHRMTIVACVRVGQVRDEVERPTGARPSFEEHPWRDVFVPMPESRAVQLPEHWMVRAYAPPYFTESLADGISNGWYETSPTSTLGGMAREFDVTLGNWVFPETAFYTSYSNRPSATPDELAGDGSVRQSFLIRFKGGSGEMDLSDAQPVLVVDPVPSLVEGKDWRSQLALQGQYRLDAETDLVRYVRRLLEPRDFTNDGQIDTADQDAVRELVGSDTTDTVLCRPVQELALYNEQHLVRAMGGGRLNVGTGCIYGTPNGVVAPDAPVIDTSLMTPAPTSAVEVSNAINRWIEGRATDATGRAQASEARIFVPQRFQPELVEVKP